MKTAVFCGNNRPMRKRAVATGLAIATIAVTCASAAGSVSVAATRPPIAKACGSIVVHGSRLQVDITEVIGLPARGCPRAKTVMQRFVRTSPPVMGNGQVRVGGKTYSCYRSRLDGEGWDYHCNWSSSGSRTRFVDFGAGRRF
jgi:hypothetical protein